MSYLLIRSPFRHLFSTEFLNTLTARSLESDGFTPPVGGAAPGMSFDDPANSQLIAVLADF